MTGHQRNQEVLNKQFSPANSSDVETISVKCHASLEDPSYPYLESDVEDSDSDSPQ